MQTIDLVFRRSLEGALRAGQAGALPLHFRAAVLHRYLHAPGAKILRSDTVGRLLRPGRPILDFGLVEDDRVIHLRFDDLVQLVAEDERDHWLDHLLMAPLSRSLLEMQRNPSSCHDDGPIREWRPPPEDE